jgi:hypothetical protein
MHTATDLPRIDQEKDAYRGFRRHLYKLFWIAVLIFILLQAYQILSPIVQYRNDVLKLLYYSDDCHAPCFMGITPGKTTRDEVVAILESHSNVIRVTAKAGCKCFIVYSREFKFSDIDEYGQLHIEYDESNIVTSLRFTNQIPMIAFIAVLGFPDGQKDFSGFAFVNEGVWLPKDCEVSYINALTTPAIIWFFAPNDPMFQNLEPHQFYLSPPCRRTWGPLF